MVTQQGLWLQKQPDLPTIGRLWRKELKILSLSHMPDHIRGESYPVFDSSDLIPCGTRALDPVEMFPNG